MQSWVFFCSLLLIHSFEKGEQSTVYSNQRPFAGINQKTFPLFLLCCITPLTLLSSSQGSLASQLSPSSSLAAGSLQRLRVCHRLNRSLVWGHTGQLNPTAGRSPDIQCLNHSQTLSYSRPSKVFLMFQNYTFLHIK